MEVVRAGVRVFRAEEPMQREERGARRHGPKLRRSCAWNDHLGGKASGHRFLVGISGPSGPVGQRRIRSPAALVSCQLVTSGYPRQVSRLTETERDVARTVCTHI